MSGNIKTDFDAGMRAIPRKMFLRMLPPCFISSVTLALANIADALVVGRQVGELGLATIGLTTPIYLIYTLLGTAFASGGAITHARLTAAEKREDALVHARRLSAELLLIGAAIAVLGNVFFGAVLNGLGAGEDVPELRELCAGYVQPLLTAAPLFFLNFLLYYFVRSDDNAGMASTGFSVGCVLDLALNILFVLGMKQGVPGAIRATIIAQGVSVLIQSVHLFSGRKGILRLKAILTAKSERGKAGELCRNSLKTGFPAAISSLYFFVFLLIGNRLLLTAGAKGIINGELAVAVFDLVANCSFVTTSVYQASSDAMQPLAATFSEEHDGQSLRCLLRMTIGTGLISGLLLAGALAVFAGPVSSLFGLGGEEAQRVSVPAIWIFLLSTPLAGMLNMLIGYAQSTGQVRTAVAGTLLRVVTLLLLLGLRVFRAGDFWWLFPATEGLSLAALLPILYRLQKEAAGREVPVVSRMMTNDNRELGTVVEAVEEFCGRNSVPAETSMNLQLAVEELCTVTMAQAFSGRSDEYIRVTLAAEPGPRYILHIRNSAPYFNPLDMRMGKAQADMTAEIMDSIGVMMVQKKARSLNYRNYQGYNVMTVEY